MAIILSFILHIFSLAYAGPDAAKLVPEGKIVSQKADEIKVKTKSGTVVEIGVDMDGELEEASGGAAEKGDVFEPGEKLITLKAAVETLKKAGKTLQGEWIFEENEEGEWVYDIEGVEKKAAVDYIVNATNGKLMKTEVDE